MHCIKKHQCVWRIVLSILCPTLLIVLTITCTRKPPHLIAPQIQAATLDLSDWDFQSGGSVDLKGDWEMFWDDFIEPDAEPDSVSNKAILAQVPSHWTDYKKTIPSSIEHKQQNKENQAIFYPVQGRASFRARVYLGKTQKQLVLRIPSSDTAMAVYINGKEVFTNGLISGESARIHPVYYAPVNIDVPEVKELNIVLHMANGFYPRPGFRDALVLGSVHAMEEQTNYRLFIEVFLLGTLVFMGVYHITLFIMRPGDRSPLYLAVFCSLVVVRILVTGEAVAFRFLPINWHISTFLEYISFYLSGSALLAFIASLYPRECKPGLNTFFHIVCAVFTIFVILTPLSIYTRSLFYFQLVIITGLVYFVYILVMAVIRRRDTARMFLIGVLILILTIANDILYANRMIATFYITPVGVFSFFFSQALLLSRRFALAFNTAETLSVRLEEKVKERTRELELARNQAESEKEKSKDLLLNILPGATAEELISNGAVEPLFYDSVTILFADFVNFTRHASLLKPNDLIDELDQLFSYFDDISARARIEKIKTIGDAYMAVGGIPLINQSHPIDVCLAALAMLRAVDAHNAKRKLKAGLTEQEHVWQLRIGIHTGSVMTGVVGRRKFAYDVFGDAVNIASRFETYNLPGRINISQSVYEAVHEFFEIEERGKIEIKNLESMDMYFLNRLKPQYAADQAGFEAGDKLRNVLKRLAPGSAI